MPILENIQLLCQKNGTTIPRLEKELLFSNGSIYKWASSSPSIDKLQKVADYFKVSTDFLSLGFERALLTQLINYVRNNRTFEQFSRDTDVDPEEITGLCTGYITSRPSKETVNKIADNNPVDFLVDRSELLKAAGFIKSETNQNHLTPPSQEELNKFLKILDETNTKLITTIRLY